MKSLNYITLVGSHPLELEEFLDRIFTLSDEQAKELCNMYLLHEELFTLAEELQKIILDDHRERDIVKALSLAAIVAKEVDSDIEKYERELAKLKESITKPKEAFLAQYRLRRTALRESVKQSFLLTDTKQACGWKLVEQHTPTFLIPEEGTPLYEDVAWRLLETPAVALKIKAREFQKFLQEHPEYVQHLGIHSELRSHVALVGADE